MSGIENRFRLENRSRRRSIRPIQTILLANRSYRSSLLNQSELNALSEESFRDRGSGGVAFLIQHLSEAERIPDESAAKIFTAADHILRAGQYNKETNVP